MKKIHILFIAILYTAISHAQQKKTVTGRITSFQDNAALPGVNVIIKGTTLGTSTNADGIFTIEASDHQTLIFSFIGYKQLELPVGDHDNFDIQLEEDIATLGEITIVSTGYQQLPKERVNGSFVQIDNRLLSRRVGTHLLARLEDVTSGLIFNRNIAGEENDISIRGMSTINSQAQPLIVIDNFPFEGDINTLNPNDVESITILKDAAAASIWGARAGNGVIVITTKRGSSCQAAKVSFNSNVTITQKPDLFYQSKMSSAQMIENERRLFDKGYYTTAETSYSSPLTPAVELLIADRDGLLSDADLENQLAWLSTYDIRNDYDKYLYRESVNQQYAINLQGGGASNRYYIAAGVDTNLDNLVGNDYSRITLNMNNAWTVLQDKLTINAGIYYSRNTTHTNNTGTSAITYNGTNPMYSYARLKDDKGNTIPITKDHRLSFVQQAEDNGLLSWAYSPIDEIDATDNKATLADYRINTSLNYSIIDGLNAEILYQYSEGNRQHRILHKADSYYTRNLINRFSSIGTDGAVTRNIPSGGILDMTQTNSSNHAFRGQVNFNKTFGEHALSALAGYEVRELDTRESITRNYGYNDDLATSQPVSYTTFFYRYDNPYSGGTIPYVDSQSSLTDRFISRYANASYTFKGRYSVSGSARRDQSNLFGVNTNQKSVPLWSAGIGWTISEEPFYSAAWLPYLKLRTTYGANGNINKKVTAYTTAYSLGYDELTGFPYSVIQNPGNPNLKWEKVKIYNLGVDFESAHRRLTGSIEFYTKAGEDLIGTRAFAPSSGVTSFTGNFASTRSHGVDVTLNSLNINGGVQWNTTLLFSLTRERVRDYESETSVASLLQYGPGMDGFVAPREGKPLYAIYSYAWAGLDPETGDPRSYVDGTPSADYNQIANTTTADKLVYHGAARPTHYGSLRNTLTWKNISFSFNISYRLGYYFRKKSVLYNEVLSGYVSHGDYGKRWMQPGDEKFTNVPSLPESYDNNREMIYTYSSALVEKGDHIRLQDISVSYTLDRQRMEQLPFTRIEIHSYINNIGILWKAASGNMDPDYPTLKPSRSIAFGVRIEF
jgi:TonB-dependent starch-binding outer membrane protein SusC